MPTDSNETSKSSVLTEIGKIRNENNFLKERVNNLESFKKNFFTLQNDLIESNEKLEVYEEALNFCQIKNRIIESHEPPVDEVEITQTDSVLGG